MASTIYCSVEKIKIIDFLSVAINCDDIILFNLKERHWCT